MLLCTPARLLSHVFFGDSAASSDSARSGASAACIAAACACAPNVCRSTLHWATAWRLFSVWREKCGATAHVSAACSGSGAGPQRSLRSVEEGGASLPLRRRGNAHVLQVAFLVRIQAAMVPRTAPAATAKPVHGSGNGNTTNGNRRCIDCVLRGTGASWLRAPACRRTCSLRSAPQLHRRRASMVGRRRAPVLRRQRAPLPCRVARRPTRATVFRRLSAIK